MSKRKRRPAPACAVCESRLEQVGGRRVVASRHRGVQLYAAETTLAEIETPSRVARLSTREFVVTFGPWSPEEHMRAVEAALEGYQPWICQRCAGSTCHRCGSPLTVPIASTLVQDDGTLSHLMIVPKRETCINPECSGAVTRLIPRAARKKT